MRIISGQWRGRTLSAPPGALTRPTAQRLRQAIFDMLLHAPWGGRALLEGASVLDGFAGTGALGLEALSRGAARATFIEQDRDALGTLQANIAACRADSRARVIKADMRRPPPGTPHALVFLDPPYDQGLLAPALAALRAQGWLGPDSLIIAESGRLEPMVDSGGMLAHRVHGAAQVRVWRES